jgi:hypothetical protein
MVNPKQWGCKATDFSEGPTTVNHIPQTTQTNAIKTAKFAGRGLQPIPACMT